MRSKKSKKQHDKTGREADERTNGEGKLEEIKIGARGAVVTGPWHVKPALLSSLSFPDERQRQHPAIISSGLCTPRGRQPSERRRDALLHVGADHRLQFAVLSRSFSLFSGPPQSRSLTLVA